MGVDIPTSLDVALLLIVRVLEVPRGGRDIPQEGL